MCRPAASQPPAVLPERPGPPSLALQMPIPPPTGRALEHNDVTVKIITHADGLEAEGVSQNSEQKGGELETRETRDGRDTVIVHGRDVRGDRGGEGEAGSRAVTAARSRTPATRNCAFRGVSYELSTAARKKETEASGNKRFAL